MYVNFNFEYTYVYFFLPRELNALCSVFGFLGEL